MAPLRTALVLRLRRAGFRVSEAKDGIDALECQDRDPAAVLITDMMMPRMDGLQTIREFRARHPAVRIVAMSGGAADAAHLELALKLGAHAVLPKPFRHEQLIAAIGSDDL